MQDLASVIIKRIRVGLHGGRPGAKTKHRWIANHADLGYSSAPLHGSIVHHATSTDSKLPAYWAISHVWGAQDFQDTLQLYDSDGDTSYINITLNVSTVLKRSRASTPNIRRRPWIDAICLNQNNATEKAHQVPNMGRIYKKAQDVHIWPCPEDEYTAGVFRFLPEVSRIPSLGTQDWEEHLIEVAAKHLVPQITSPLAQFF